MDSLIEHTKRRKVTEGAKMMYCRGEAKTCDVRIGRIVSVQMPENMGGTDLGKYRIYSIVHEFEQNGRYKCNFEGIPADLKYIPTPKVKIPVINPLEIKIWDNNDPEGMGRVRVEFTFDEKVCDTWIPVMTFDAGSDAKGSGGVKTNRGTVIIPEISDHCLLSFLDGQELSHPFIMGSIFHGKSTDNQGGGKGNHIKTFTDKAGSFWKFDSNKGSVTIQDKKGSESQILLDGEQNLNVKAGKSVDVNVGEGACVLHMKHDGVTTIKATKKIELSVGGSTYTMTSDNIAQKSKNNSITGTNHITGGDTKIDGGQIILN